MTDGTFHSFVYSVITATTQKQTAEKHENLTRNETASKQCSHWNQKDRFIFIYWNKYVQEFHYFWRFNTPEGNGDHTRSCLLPLVSSVMLINLHISSS